MDATTYLLHDTSLSLGEGDVSSALVLNELDINLPPLATTLLIVVIVIWVGELALLCWTSSVAIIGRVVSASV